MGQLPKNFLIHSGRSLSNTVTMQSSIGLASMVPEIISGGWGQGGP